MHALGLRISGDKLFLILGLSLIVAISTMTIVRSQARKSILAGSIAAMTDSAFDEFQDTGTRIHLQDFHRVEVKDGRTMWEVKAKDAVYYAEEKVTHINDSSVVVYRRGDSPVRIRSASAKLLMAEDSIKRAELEGKIEVSLEQGVTVLADVATYDAGSRLIDAPGAVKIVGNGYEVGGKRATLIIDQGVAKLAQDVYSQFQPRAKVPQILDEKEKKVLPNKPELQRKT